MRILKQEEWLELKAMPIQKVQQILLDLVFITPSESFKLTGTAFDLENRTEDFGLEVREFDSNRWWKSKDDTPETAWRHRDFKTEWFSSKLHSLLTPPRKVRFFTTSNEPEWVKPPTTFLGRCKAIEFSKEVKGDRVQAVFLSSENYPCSLEFSTEPDSCKKMLEGLVEISLPHL